MGAPRAAWLRQVSFRTRLSLLAAAAVGMAIALVAVFSFFAVRHQLLSQVSTSLLHDSGQLQEQAARPGPQGTTILRLDELLTLAQADGDLAQVFAADGSLVSASAPRLPISKIDQAVAAGTVEQSYRNVYAGGRHYRVLTEQVGKTFSGENVALQVAHPLADADHTLRDLEVILFFVGLAGIALAIGLGYVVARATIRPVERLTAAVEHVAATQDLDATIDEPGHDELTRLAHGFNSMLAALRGSRQQQAQLVADAGHELRTPLTSLRTNIEVLMKAYDLPLDDRAALLTDVQAQLEELTTLIGDIVELAREDEQQTEPTEVRLDLVVARAVERARRRAPSLTFHVDLTPGQVRAQPALLERAVLNVLDNAAKWSPPGGTVDVALRRGDAWQLDVRDHGPGIAPDDLPRVFDRFYRASTARSMSGSGLGLAIVHQVITAHGGQVAVASPPDGGTWIHIELPIVAEDEPELPAYLPLSTTSP